MEYPTHLSNSTYIYKNITYKLKYNPEIIGKTAGNASVFSNRDYVTATTGDGKPAPVTLAHFR